MVFQFAVRVWASATLLYVFCVERDCFVSPEQTEACCCKGPSLGLCWQGDYADFLSCCGHIELACERAVETDFPEAIVTKGHYGNRIMGQEDFNYDRTCWQPIREKFQTARRLATGWAADRLDFFLKPPVQRLMTQCCKHYVFSAHAETCFRNFQEHASCCFPGLRKNLAGKGSSSTLNGIMTEITAELDDVLGGLRFPTLTEKDQFEKQWGHLFLRLQVKNGTVRMPNYDRIAHLQNISNEDVWDVQMWGFFLDVLKANAAGYRHPLEGLDVFVSTSQVLCWLPNSLVPVFGPRLASVTAGGRMLNVPAGHWDTSDWEVFPDAIEDSSEMAFPSRREQLLALLPQYPWHNRTDRVFCRHTAGSAFTRCSCGNAPLSKEYLNSQPRRNFHPKYEPRLAGEEGPCPCAIMDTTEGNWHHHPRFRAVLLSRLFPEHLDCEFASQHGYEGSAQDKFAQWRLPSQLEPPTGLGQSSFRRFLQHKYVLIVSGVTPNIARRLWLLFTGATVFLVETPFRQAWLRTGLVAWKHYIPVREDLEDLQMRLYWARDNQEKAFSIAQAALSFAQTQLGHGETFHYMFRLLYEYDLRRKGMERLF